MDEAMPVTMVKTISPKEAPFTDRKMEIEKVRRGLVGELPDEVFELTRDKILRELQTNGLMRIYFDLGIPLLPIITAGQRGELNEKGHFSLKEGEETDVRVWYYPKIEQLRRARGILSRSPYDQGFDQTGTHYTSGAKVVTLVCAPEKMGRRLLYFSDIGKLGINERRVELLRVHEYAHRWNSETGMFAQNDVIAEFFREAHSVMAEHLSGVFSDEKWIIDTLSVDRGGTSMDTNFETHPRMVTDLQARAKAEYATSILWKLLVLDGGNYRMAGERVMIFQNKHMLDWDPKQTLCPKVETYLGDLIKKQGFGVLTLEEQIRNYKLNLSEQWRRTSVVFKSGLREFADTIDLTDGVIFSGIDRVSYCARKLGNQFLGRGSVFEVKLDSEGFHLSRVDFKKGTITQMDSDLSENVVDFWIDGVNGSLKNRRDIVSKAGYFLEKSLLLSPDNPYLMRTAEKIVDMLEKSRDWGKYLSGRLKEVIAAYRIRSIG